MVYGLDKFREAFADFTDNYVIIGGTACDTALEGTSMRARATDDIDMIVVVEHLTSNYIDAFWNFIRDGQYKNGKRKRGESKQPAYEMYRFKDPIDGYPVQIELLARHSDMLGEPSGFHIEPLPTEEEQYSLSAIMMDDDYYNLTIQHSIVVGGLRIASPVALVGLKTRAYLNLQEERAKGRQVNTKDIMKHRNDVLKLAVTIPRNADVRLSETITAGIRQFIAEMRTIYPSASLRDALGVGDEEVAELIDTLEDIFIHDEQ